MENRDEAAVRARAYQLWVESGYADGYQDQHWRQAEREIAERAAANGGDLPAEAAPHDRARSREGRHSDGMSSHPSVLDPAPSRQRA